MFMPHQRPKLPATQRVSLTKVEERVNVIVSYDISFPRLAVDRKHDEKNLVAKKTILDMAIERNDRSIILVRIRRALLHIKRQDIKTIPRALSLSGPASEVEQLEQLPPILFAVPIVGE